MNITRKDKINLLDDAISDREEYFNCVSGDTELEEDTQNDINELKTLLSKFKLNKKVVFDSEDWKIFRKAALFAYYNNEGLRDANKGFDKRICKRADKMLKISKYIFSITGGSPFSEFENAKLVNVTDLFKR